MTVIHMLIGMFNSNPMIPQYYWNGQLVWTPGVGISKGRKCLRYRKCIASTNYDNNLRSGNTIN